MDSGITGERIAFAGDRCIARGPLSSVARDVVDFLAAEPEATVLVFDAATSAPVEIDLRGGVDAVLARLPPEPAANAPERGPGRPKLGVVPREVTLLPRHWAWLAEQPGGASVALRKLVEDALRANAGRDRVRRARDAANRFVTVMAGDRPGYEEATRALFAGDRAGYEQQANGWPKDIREHALALAAPSFADEGTPNE